MVRGRYLENKTIVEILRRALSVGVVGLLAADGKFGSDFEQKVLVIFTKATYEQATYILANREEQRRAQLDARPWQVQRRSETAGAARR